MVRHERVVVCVFGANMHSISMRPAVTRYDHNIVCLRILRLQVVRITPGLLERDVWAETVVAMLRNSFDSCVHMVQPCGLPGAGD